MMMTLLLVMQWATVQPISFVETPRAFRIDVVFYQGDPSGKTHQRQKISSPQLMTLNKQQAVIAVGQEVPLLQPDEATVTDELRQFPIKLETVGIKMTLTPHALKTGEIILTGCIKTSEIAEVSQDIQHKIDHDVRIKITCKPNEPVTIPLYDLNDYIEKTKAAGLPDIVTITKPFTGKEKWVELKVCELLSEK
jgi:hypothetical protein